jgi:protein-disulfide isomerase
LILIALSALTARFCEARELSDPLLARTDSGSSGHSLSGSGSVKFGNLILTNLFGLAVLAIFIYAVKPGSGWEPPKVATVDGEDVNFFELQWLASDKTYKQDLEIYPIQKQALQERIDELVITHAAKKAGQSVDAYLAAKKVESDPTTDEGRKKRADLITELSKSATISNNLRMPTPQILMMDPCHGIPVGDPTAPIRLVIFSDFECPYCRDAFPVLDTFLKKHPKDISVLYCQFPLKELHPLATTAAMAGLCAQQQGKYAEYHDFLYKVADVKKGLTPEGLRDAAKQSGMNLVAYDKCLASPETGKCVENSIKESQDLNIPGIPAVYFNGKYMLKGPTAESLEKLYNEAMNEESAKAQESPQQAVAPTAPLSPVTTNSVTPSAPTNIIPSEIKQ